VHRILNPRLLSETAICDVASNRDQGAAVDATSSVHKRCSAWRTMYLPGLTTEVSAAAAAAASLATTASQAAAAKGKRRSPDCVLVWEYSIGCAAKCRSTTAATAGANLKPAEAATRASATSAAAAAAADRQGLTLVHFSAQRYTLSVGHAGWSQSVGGENC